MGDDERRAMDRSWPRSGGGQLRKGGVLVPGASRARSALFQLMNRPFRGGKDVTSKVLLPACAVPFRCECTVHYGVCLCTCGCACLSMSMSMSPSVSVRVSACAQAVDKGRAPARGGTWNTTKPAYRVPGLPCQGGPLPRITHAPSDKKRGSRASWDEAKGRP